MQTSPHSLKVGINGFGRIGRLLTRCILCQDKECNDLPEVFSHDYSNLEIVAINDPSLTIDSMLYLLKYDSVHGRCNVEGAHIHASENTISLTVSCGIKSSPREFNIKIFNETQPRSIPWASVGAEYIAECSGLFTSTKACNDHLLAGAKKVVISAPPAVDDKDMPVLIMGVNQDTYSASTMKIVSNASCTTNCIAPLAKVLDLLYGIEEGSVTAIHAVTASQKVVDGPSNRDPRAGRSYARNIIPASTGAAVALGKVLPQLSDKLHCSAFRVPVENVSVIDFSCRLKRPMESLSELIMAIKQVEEDRFHFLHGFLGVTFDDVVSSDFCGDERSCVLDAKASKMISPTFIKLVAYYDNEWAYSMRMKDLLSYMHQCEHTPKKA